MTFLRLPFFAELEKSQTILLAGAGGGFDFFCGLPLYAALKNADKTVHLANLSFSDITSAQARHLSPICAAVTADSLGNENYFPELHFARWMRGRGEEVTVYAFEKTGVVPLREAYEILQSELKFDTLILVDGGTDSLMRGDEAGLGTPVEDISSILAANVLDVPRKMLVCLGFGVDAFHGVCHAHFLEAVADITRRGGNLGLWSLTPDMPEVEFYRQASEFVFRKMTHHPSIVSSSILSAIEGQFGDYHTTARTQNSKLFINALMTIYWCLQLQPVAERVLYPESLMQTESAFEVAQIIEEFRHNTKCKPYEDLPM